MKTKFSRKEKEVTQEIQSKISEREGNTNLLKSVFVKNGRELSKP